MAFNRRLFSWFSVAAVVLTAALISGCLFWQKKEFPALQAEIVAENDRGLTVAVNGLQAVLKSGSARTMVGGVPVILPQEFCKREGRWFLPELPARFLRAVLHRKQAAFRHVVLDPGHGGGDVGTIGVSGVREKDLNLALALAVKRALESRGFTVSLTRSGDVELALAGRTAKAAAYRGELFISLHHNSAKPKKEPCGFEVFVHNSAKGETAVYLAYLMQAKQRRVTGNPGRGVKCADFAVLRTASMPAVLIEAGFLSNPDEESLCRQPGYRAELAAAIADAVAEFRLSQMSTERRPPKSR